MKKENYNMIVLRASEGNTIINKEHTLFAKEIYLGKNDSPDNYLEVDDEYANRLREEYEKQQSEEGYKPAPVTLDDVKECKIAEITAYDKSSAVNEFTLKGHPAWLDKDTRVGLSNSLNYEKAAGRTESTMWFGGVPLTLKIEYAFKMLAALELYALECYNVTASHKASVSKMETIEAVENYDYNVGYPDKLNF